MILTRKNRKLGGVDADKRAHQSLQEVNSQALAAMTCKGIAERKNNLFADQCPELLLSFLTDPVPVLVSQRTFK